MSYYDAQNKGTDQSQEFLGTDFLSFDTANYKRIVAKQLGIPAALKTYFAPGRQLFAAGAARQH